MVQISGGMNTTYEDPKPVREACFCGHMPESGRAQGWHICFRYMKYFINLLAMVTVCVFVLAPSRAAAFDTTISFTGGRQHGTFMMDGRSNMALSPRSDVADTVTFSLGLSLIRVVTEGQLCITGCSYGVPTALVVQGGETDFGYKGASDTLWDSATWFPAQLMTPDSIGPASLSPCHGAIPVGVGFMVSSDDASSVGGGCADKSTFHSLPGYNQILYARKDGVHMKLQVAGFVIDSTDCVSGHPLYRCTRGDKIVFRYVITDDSAGHFGSDPISIRSREKPTPPSAGRLEAWRTGLYQLILGRTPREPR